MLEEEIEMVFPQGPAVPGFKPQTASEPVLVWFEMSSEFSPPALCRGLHSVWLLNCAELV